MTTFTFIVSFTAAVCAVYQLGKDLGAWRGFGRR